MNYPNGNQRIQVTKPGIPSSQIPIKTSDAVSEQPRAQNYSEYLSLQNSSGQRLTTSGGSSYSQSTQYSAANPSRYYSSYDRSSVEPGKHLETARTSANTIRHSYNLQNDNFLGGPLISRESNQNQISSSSTIQGGSNTRLISSQTGSNQQVNTFNTSTYETQTYQPRISAVIQGTPVVVDVKQGQDRIVSEKVTDGGVRVVNERELRRQRKSETREIKRIDVTEEKVKKEKVIELIKEKPVPVEVYVDTVYDVVIDVPVERTIEKEVIHEVTVEKKIEKVIEIPVEQIVEIPVETVIERPVEQKVFVEVPHETVKKVPFDVFRENVIYRENYIDVDESEVNRYPGATVLSTAVDYQFKTKKVEKPVYVDNVIHRDVNVPKQKVIEVPRERVIEKKFPVYHDNPVPVEKIIYQEVEVPVANEIIKPVEVVYEKPVYIENIIEKPIPVEKIVEKERLIPVEHIVEKPVPIENVVQRPYDFFKEVPVPREHYNEVYRDQYHENVLNVERVRERPVEKLVKTSTTNIQAVEVPVEVVIEKVIPILEERTIEKKVNRFSEKPSAKIIEKPTYIERYSEKPIIVERTIEVPVERVIDNVRMVEKLIEKPVYIESVIEREVEHIVVKDIHIPVERVVEVEVEVAVEKPIFRETIINEDLILEATCQEYDENFEQEEIFEHEDEEMANEIMVRESELNTQIRQNNNLRDQYKMLRAELTNIHNASLAVEESENHLLKAKFAELLNKLAFLEEQRVQIVRKNQNRVHHVDTQIRRDPRVDALRSKLKTLIGENNALSDEVYRVGEQLKKTISQKRL